jgi:hypothetical protein
MKVEEITTYNKQSREIRSGIIKCKHDIGASCLYVLASKQLNEIKLTPHSVLVLMLTK